MLLLLSSRGFAADNTAPSETDFRAALGLSKNITLTFRALDCSVASYATFSKAMQESGMHTDVDRAVDGSEVTVTVRRRGDHSCSSPYPPVTEIPTFDLRDLSGKRVTAASLRGKPTLMNFYFAQCVPCILEVGPINRYAAQHAEMNFLAMTSDEPAVARAFVDRFKFRWRVVPEAQDFLDRLRVKQYPTMALFDSSGRLLGTRLGGVRDELEAANVGPQLARWVDGLLRQRLGPARVKAEGEP